MLQIDCDTEHGGLKLNEKFLVDFGKDRRPGAGPRDALPRRRLHVGHLELIKRSTHVALHRSRFRARDGFALRCSRRAAQDRSLHRRRAFHINGQPTYAGRTWQGHKIEGLLLNSRMVQGIFDDLNPETVEQVGLSRHGQVGRRAEHARVHRRDAGVAEARPLGVHDQPARRQPAGLFAEISPGTTRPSTPTASCGRTTWPAWSGFSTKPTSWAWSRSSASSTSARTSGWQDEAAVKRAVDNTVDWVFDRGYRTC